MQATHAYVGADRVAEGQVDFFHPDWTGQIGRFQESEQGPLILADASDEPRKDVESGGRKRRRSLQQPLDGPDVG
ncbi:hypothetical protein, partial [Mesorhizobium sp. M4A.F.Ca.ET.050.02.1.1]|uniref:hypothetical protein n=1 Tax=Mesorhizobium sp. M4A.F.Ca.ET.050.02.1.1 TaxID=2496754 RepID=UPI001AEC7764